MTKDDNFGLFRKIEDKKKYVEIPLVAVSDKYDESLRSACVRAGVNEYLEPPFHRDIIPVRIRNAARAKDSVTFREMENMLKELPSNIYFKDADGKYIFSSHYWHHLNQNNGAGWTIRGKTDYDIQKDVSIADKAFISDKNIIESGKGDTYILELNDDGEQEFLQVIKSPTYDSSGNVSGIIAIMNDVSELEKLKRKLEDRSIAIDAELRVAAQIQYNMLPMEFEKHRNISISASMTPAQNVGGDFYDYFFIDSDHIGLVMADVSGKGVPAALFMAINKIVIHDRALVGGTPADILHDANDRICSTNKMGLFVTVWLGILDLKSGTITCTNAGHEYPAIKNGSSGYRPIGTIPGIDYQNETLVLNDGDSLFLYTDGATDIKAPGGERFGIDRVIGLLDSTMNCDPDETIRAMTERIDAFIGNAERFDDTTLMCVKYHKG